MTLSLDFTPVTVPDELLVGGRWRRGGGRLMQPRNPADGQPLAAIHGADASDVDDAIRRGLAAARADSWRNLLPHQRASYLCEIGRLIDQHADWLAGLQTANTGKTLTETRALVASAANTFRFFAAALTTQEDEVPAATGSYLTMSVQEPIGVIGAITPWNSPIASDAQKIAPALAAGNAVVLKPAEWTPLVSLALGRLIADSGLPAGLLSVLPGQGSVVGDAIVRHPDVGKVSFTGGTATGRLIGATAASKVMPVSLELGGKSPTIVLPDADLRHAIPGILFGIFSSSGQSCIAGSRLFLPEARYQEILTELVARTTRLRVGPGTDPRTQVGPLVTFAHRDAVSCMVDAARAEGARVLCGGEPPRGANYERGAYYLPTVLDGLANSSTTCQQEIFGPVLVALPYRDEDDLVTQANDSVYGLACGIWSRDYQRAWQLARRIEAGTVWVNTYKQFSISTPFGGMKASGIGREKGRAGIAAYSRQKSIYWGMSPDPIGWAQ